jgi:hypothetical protein
MPENGSRHEALAREIARYVNTGGGGSTTTTSGGSIATSVSINDPDNGVTLNIDANGNITIANSFMDATTFTTSFGSQTDAAAVSDTTAASFVSLFKRLLTRFTTLLGRLPLSLTESGALKTESVEASSAATITSPASATESQVLLAANPNRKSGSSVFNDSTASLYLALGANAASATNFTVEIAARGYYELPKCWKGEVRGAWASANGFSRITELT